MRRISKPLMVWSCDIRGKKEKKQKGKEKERKMKIEKLKNEK